MQFGIIFFSRFVAALCSPTISLSKNGMTAPHMTKWNAVQFYSICNTKCGRFILNKPTTCDHEDVNLSQFLLFRVNFSPDQIWQQYFVHFHCARRDSYAFFIRCDLEDRKYDYILIEVGCCSVVHVKCRYAILNFSFSVWTEC